MRVLLGAVVALAVTLTQAVGQTPLNPVIEHYRAFRAALDRNDLATAQAEAEQALAASELRDGDGGRTAVLALNLATTRLRAGRAEEALAPARRALTLAEAGAGGVNATHAALTVGRAELATEGRAGANRLRTILAEAPLDGVDAADIYAAATALGHRALAEREFDTATLAWSTAAAHAEGSAFGAVFGFGHARTGQGATIFMDEIGRTGGERMNLENAHEAYRLLLEAQRTLEPLAALEAPNLELTVAQRAYAEAMAWRAALRAKLSSNRQPLPEGIAEAQGDADGFAELGPVDLALPRCLYRLNAEPRPNFPRAALQRGRLAGVVLRVRVDDSGRIVESGTVARIGEESFSEALDRVSSRWTVSRRDDSPPNCRAAATMLVPVSFSIRG